MSLDNPAPQAYTGGMSEYTSVDFAPCDGCGTVTLADALEDVQGDGGRYCTSCAMSLMHWLMLAPPPVVADAEERW